MLSESKGSYQVTQEAINELSSNIQRAAGFCERKAVLANMQKHATRTVGGTVATGVFAAGVAGGVAASVVAGIFTFGIGTIVGLSLTAAGSVAAGSGIAALTGVATHCIAVDRQKLETEFRTLLRSFREVESHAMRVEDFINALQTIVELISNSVDNATPIDEYEETSALVVAFDCICEAFGESYERPTTHRQNLMARESELRARLNELHIQ